MLLSYLTLGLILLCTWAFSLLVFNGELFCPAATVPMVMLAATLLAAIGLDTWNSWALSGECIFLISAATIAFVAGCCLSKRLAPAAKVWATPLDRAKVSLDPDDGKWLLLLLLLVVALYSHVSEIMRIASEAGMASNGYAAAASWVRSNTSAVFSGSAVSLTAGFSLVDRLLGKCSRAIGYLALAWLLFSLRNRKWKSFRHAAILILLYVACSFSGGGRGGAFVFAIALVLGFFVLELRESARTDNVRISLKFGIMTGFLVIVGALGFFAAGTLVGRSAGSNPVEYLSFYLGGGIPAFQRTLVEGFAQFDWTGFNTFHEQYYLLQKVGLVSGAPAYGNFWLNMGGHSCNVFTFVYRYYADFGLPGIIFFPGIGGFLFTLLYERAFRPTIHPASLAMFLMVGAILFDVERDAKLFGEVLTANTLLTVLIIAVIGAWFFAPQKNKVAQLSQRCASAAKRDGAPLNSE